MGLDKQIASRFIREVSANDKKPAKTKVRGTVNIVGNDTYVILDGSESITPVTTTVGVNDGDRVIVDLDNHSAVVTGNETSNAIDETGFYKLLEDGSLDVNVNNLNVDAGGSVTVKSGGSVNLNDKLILNENGTLTLNIDSLSIGNSESIDNLEDLKGADGAPGAPGPPGPEGASNQYVKYHSSGNYKGINVITDTGLAGVHTNVNNGAFSVVENTHKMLTMGSFKTQSEYDSSQVFDHSYISAQDGIKISTKRPDETGYSTKPFVQVTDQAAFTNNGPIIGGELDGTTLYLYCDVLGGA